MCPHTQLQRGLSEALIRILHSCSDAGHLGHTLTSSSPARYHTNKNGEAGEHNPVAPWDCCKENEQGKWGAPAAPPEEEGEASPKKSG